MTYLTYKGQRYDNIGTVPYVRTDGGSTTLAVWRSLCADCGEPFEFKTTLGKHSLRWPSRRCAGCKRPGVRVTETVH
jgi:hypothetical protein